MKYLKQLKLENYLPAITLQPLRIGINKVDHFYTERVEPLNKLIFRKDKRVRLL